jgi:hypothetical protein
MEIKFKIMEVLPEQHSMVVRYYSDVLTEDSLAISFNPDGSIARRPDGSPQRCQTDYNFNIWQTNPALSQDDIKRIANDGAPYDWFKLKHDILDPNIDTSLSAVSSLISQEFVAQKPISVVELAMQNETQENADIESEIQKIIDSLTSASSSANT